MRFTNAGRRGNLPTLGKAELYGFFTLPWAFLALCYGIAIAPAHAQDTSSDQGAGSAAGPTSSQDTEEQKHSTGTQSNSSDQGSGQSQTYTFTFERMATQPDGAESQAEGSDEAQGATPAPAQGQNAPSNSKPAPTEVQTIPVKPTDTAKKEEPRPSSPESKRAVELGTVTVTATKREKSLREIPASINSLSGEDLERQGIQSMEEIARLVPGVNLTRPVEEGQRITIRGIAPGSGTNPTAGVMFGDVSFTDLYLPRVTLDPEPFDLKDVEVLKGPQGTLFGAGALNGAIRYVPNPPEFGAWETKYFAQYTTLHDGGRAPIYGAALNAPIGDQFALRVVGFNGQSPGWIDVTEIHKKAANRVDRQGIRGILGWQSEVGLKAALTYARQTTTSPDTSIADNLDGKLKADNRPQGSPERTLYNLADLHLNDDFGWSSLISESAYVRKFFKTFLDESSRAPVPNTPTLGRIDLAHSGTWSQELRLVSPIDLQARWEWVTGLFATRQNAFGHVEEFAESPGIPIPLISSLTGLTTGSGEPNALALTFDVVNTEYAWFGDVTRHLGDSWELELGGRLYRTTSSGVVDQSGAVFVAANRNPNQRIAGRFLQRGFNPKFSLLWHATRNILGYTAISKGFRIGGVQPGFTTPTAGNPTAQVPPTFKTDTIWNYEAGLRTQWLQNTLQFDTTVFFEQWRKPQVFQLDPNGLGAFLDNVGSAKSKGVEVALQSLLPLGLSLKATAALTDTVTTATFRASDGNDVPPGTQWPFSPRWQTAATLAHTLPLGSWILGSSVTHTFLDKAPNTLAPTQKHNVFGYQQWDVLFNLSNPSLRWFPEVALIGNNLLDERGFTNLFMATQVTDVTYIRPRAITLRLSGKF